MHTSIEKISHRNPLYNTRNLTQYSIANYLEKEAEKKCMSLSISKPSCCRWKMEKKKKKEIQGEKCPQPCNSPVQASLNYRITNKQMLNLFLLGHGVVGWCHISEAWVSWGFRAGVWSGWGSWQHVAGHVCPDGPGVVLASFMSLPNSGCRQALFEEIQAYCTQT